MLTSEGSFTSVNGTRAANIAEINTRGRGVVKRFAHDASDVVQTLAATKGHPATGRVGGHARQQIFMVHLGGRSAKVTGWTSLEFDRHCFNDEPNYVKAASWSPSDATVYIATTGTKPHDSPSVGGLCDAAVAFPASDASVHHEWINYTGCDSLFSSAADSGTAYFGRPRALVDEPHGCNRPGNGAIPAQGMEGLSPATGALYLNSHR